MVHVSLYCSLTNSGMATVEGVTDWDTTAELSQIGFSSSQSVISLYPSYVLVVQTWKKLNQGFLICNLPLFLQKTSKQMSKTQLYANIIPDKCYSSSVILHPSGLSCSSLHSKLLEILDVFLTNSNFREKEQINYSSLKLCSSKLASAELLSQIDFLIAYKNVTVLRENPSL